MPLKGYKQSDEHKKKHLIKIRGEKNPRWKGGIKLDKEYFKKKYKEWRLKNLSKDAHRKNTRRALERGSGGSFTHEEWELLKKQYGFKCPRCQQLEPNIKLERDHIIPITKGGSNFIENIQPLCRSCNAWKNNKIVDKFKGE